MLLALKTEWKVEISRNSWDCAGCFGRDETLVVEHEEEDEYDEYDGEDDTQVTETESQQPFPIFRAASNDISEFDHENHNDHNDHNDHNATETPSIQSAMLHEWHLQQTQTPVSSNIHNPLYQQQHQQQHQHQGKSHLHLTMTPASPMTPSGFAQAIHEQQQQQQEKEKEKEQAKEYILKRHKSTSQEKKDEKRKTSRKLALTRAQTLQPGSTVTANAPYQLNRAITPLMGTTSHVTAAENGITNGEMTDNRRQLLNKGVHYKMNYGTTNVTNSNATSAAAKRQRIIMILSGGTGAVDSPSHTHHTMTHTMTRATSHQAELSHTLDKLNAAIDTMLSPHVLLANEDGMLFAKTPMSRPFAAPMPIKPLTPQEIREIHELTSDKKCNMWETGFNAFNVMIGPNILGMPFALAISGYVELITIICICIFTGITAFFIDDILTVKAKENINNMPIRGYAEMVDSVLGKKAATATIFFVCFEFYLYVVLNAIFAGQTLYGVLPLWMIDNNNDRMHNGHIHNTWDFLQIIDFSPQSCIVIIMIIVLPTVYLRDLKPLSYLSSFGALAMLTIFVALLKLFIEGSPFVNDTHFRDQSGYVSYHGMFYCFGMCIATYSGHAAFPNMKSSMKDPSKFKMVIWIVYIIVMISLILVAYMGYYTFGAYSQSLIQLNFPNADIVSLIANLMLILKTWSTVALLLLPVSSAMDDLIQFDWLIKLCRKNRMMDKQLSNNDSPFFKTAIIRTILICIATFIAYILPNFDFMSNLIGAICALSMTMLIPSVVFIQFVKDQRIKVAQNKSDYSISDFKYGMAYVMIICGIFICISNLYELFRYGSKGPPSLSWPPAAN